MKHTSIPLNVPCEIIELSPVNPLISKCQIKVCYVGDEPNRNGSVITKEVAKEMANSLPGSPIVGYFNDDTQDFEEHNRDIKVVDGQLKFIDTTRPYGFVDLGAKVWFQKFLDDGSVEHEYLMTEGYLWTGQYPEAQRVIDKGNNQSMELDENSLQGHWAEIEKNGPEFFIINEAIISKLCILGEEYEPCFEGSAVTKVQFSFEPQFKEKLFSLIEQMKTILKEGGTQMTNETTDAIIEDVEKDPEITEGEESIENVTESEVSETVEPIDTSEEPVVEEQDASISEEKTDDTVEENFEGKKVEYNIEEIQEYIELKNSYSQLENNYNEIVSQNSQLQSEIETLKEFKAKVEKIEKQKMIDSFTMLEDEEKLDVITNIDKYSLDEIEAKLSVICVRNGKIGNSTKTEEPTNYSYNIDSADFTDNTPAWLKAVKAVQERM